MWQTLKLNTKVFTLPPACLLVVIMVKYCCLLHTLVLQTCPLSSLTSVHLYMSVVYHFVASIPDIVNNNVLLEISTTKKFWSLIRRAMHRTHNLRLLLRWIRLCLLEPGLDTWPCPRQTIEYGAQWQWQPTTKTQSARGKKICPLHATSAPVQLMSPLFRGVARGWLLICYKRLTNAAHHPWRAKTCPCQFIHQKLHTDTK